MNFPVCVLLVVVSCVGVFTQTLIGKCQKPINFGKTCSTAKPSIRYHFDNETGLCMAFKFKGCDGNKNNFETEFICSSSCKPTSNVGCPVNSKPLNKTDGGILCKLSEECGSNGYCSMRLSGGGICCRKAVQKKLNADYNPACDTGRVVVKVDDDEVLIGKNCDSKFCPSGSKCMKGTYFSTCCKEV